MAAATLSSKGQLVIPKEIREHMSLKAGDRVDFIVLDSGEVIIRPLVSDVRALRGLLKRPRRKPVSVAEMKRAVKRRAGRGTR
jgi:AbrB family looped-hinge helix DNA binding protein